MAKVIMIQGTMSNAGKSIIAEAYAVSFIRMDTAWRLLSRRIWH